MTRLSARERRLVALLLLVAAIAGLWLIVVAPLAGGFTARSDEREALRATYARDDRAIAQIAQLRRHADRQRRDRSRFQLVAPNLAAGQAALRQSVTARIAAAGGELRSIQDLPAPPGGVRARVDCRLTLAQLETLLVRLGNALPLLVVDGLTVAADESLQTGRLGPLDVRLEIAADLAAPAPR